MEWKKANVELPEDQQEVLIRYRGIVGLAIYSSEHSTFELSSGEMINAKLQSLSWAGLIEKIHAHKQ